MADDGKLELLGAIMAQNARDAAFTTNALLDSWENRALTAEVQLDLIRETIGDLLYGPYAPSAHALERALYPSSHKIEHLVDLRRKEGN